jgi:hypothetical protein
MSIELHTSRSKSEVTREAVFGPISYDAVYSTLKIQFLMRCHDAAIEPETWHMRPLSFYMLYPTDYGHTKLKAKSQIPLPNKLGYKGLV